MEQDNLLRQMTTVAGGPLETTFNSVGIVRGHATRLDLTKVKYMRCPSDGWNLNDALSNYAGSLGPQCSDGGCSANTYQPWCQPETSGAGGGLAAMGYSWSPDHGNTNDPSQVRGMFNRLGCMVQINMASASDGLSNTIMIGEVLPEQHDHYFNGHWLHFNGGAAHHTTIVPINYQTTERARCGSNPLNSFGNWNLAWGFKSRHSGGANFVFGDGSVRFLAQGIDHRTYQLLGCRNDGMPVTLP